MEKLFQKPNATTSIFNKDVIEAKVFGYRRAPYLLQNE